MSGLEIVALTAFIGFMIGFVCLCVTSVLMLNPNHSKRLEFLFKLSIIIYGVGGFTSIVLSFIYEIMK